jgi:hypothetical protein
MAHIHPAYIVTTIITTFADGKKMGSATGFFFTDDNNNLYVITNRHVIYGDNYEKSIEPQIDKITLNLHTNASDLTQNEEVTIDLFDKANRKWLEHNDQSVDVVLIPVNLDKEKYVFSSLNRSFLECPYWVHFEKIMVVGYPYGWYDYVNNLPIIRIGHLSSPFKVPFQGKPVMIGDVITHAGMSGGPVFMDLRDPLTKQPDGKFAVKFERKFLLVGINSGQFKIPETTERPNLIHIWFPELILEIANMVQ